jgi:hypothetical protein
MEINAATHEAIGRIDANVQTLVADAAVTRRRLSTVEKRQWIGIGGMVAAGALLLPKYHELLSIFAI